jgi:DNA mismatch repair ATPase MutS
MGTPARELANREQAYRDFCNLEAQGIIPNPNALYNYYIEMNRSNPELRPRIPTTNRTTVYQWAKEDRWNERYAELKKQHADIEAEKYDKVRQNSYGKLVSFQNEALDALLDLTRHSKDAKVRLQAAE